MKTRAISYWTATSLIALETLMGGATDLGRGKTMLIAGERVADIVTELGYPSYILTILGVWKLLGGITLLVPSVPRLKEWAYAGIFFELSGAAASHLVSRQRRKAITPLMFAALAIASWALRPPSRTLGTPFWN